MASFYQEAAKILKKALSHEASLKNLTLSNPAVENKKKMMAVLCRTLQCSRFDSSFIYR
jgi:hypothetical protein